MNDAILFSPTRSLWIWWRGAWRRYRCGRRFGHSRAEDSFGYGACARCGTPLL